MDINRMSEKSLIFPYIKDIFRDVKPGWKQVIMSPELKESFINSLNSLNKYLIKHGVTKVHLERNGLYKYIRPAPEHILEAFKYFEPTETRCIIIGQDPYLKPGEACGLAFGVPNDVEIPKSLLSIHQCLTHFDIMDKEESLKSGNLTNWAKQGVLLLNRYLTRSPDIRSDSKGEIWIEGNGNSDSQFLHEFWADFTNKLLNYLTVNVFNPVPAVDAPLRRKGYLAILMWGRIAQEIKLFINPTPSAVDLVMMEWAHPVYLPKDIKQSFTYCDHFIRVNADLAAHGLPKINWSIPG